MNAPAEAYPLTWPQGWKRLPAHARTRAKFGKGETQRSNDGMSSWTRKKELSIADGRQRVIDSLERMGARAMVISTNLALRLDNLPRSGQAQPADPGVAVYWTSPKGEARCIAVDRFDRVADNLAAVAGTLEALRTVERYGGAAILDRAFTGFVALPPPMDLRTWRQVLSISEGVRVTELLLDEAYMRARSAAHPDKGGAPGEFDAVQKCYEAAKLELGYA